MEEQQKFKCDKCRGDGVLIIERGSSLTDFKRKICDKCQGAGILDWIENIVGKKPKPFPEAIVDQAALKIADDVDKEIINALSAKEPTTSTIVKPEEQKILKPNDIKKMANKFGKTRLIRARWRLDF